MPVGPDFSNTYWHNPTTGRTHYFTDLRSMKDYGEEQQSIRSAAFNDGFLSGSRTIITPSLGGGSSHQEYGTGREQYVESFTPHPGVNYSGVFVRPGSVSVSGADLDEERATRRASIRQATGVDNPEFTSGKNKARAEQQVNAVVEAAEQSGIPTHIFDTARVNTELITRRGRAHYNKGKIQLFDTVKKTQVGEIPASTREITSAGTPILNPNTREHLKILSESYGRDGYTRSGQYRPSKYSYGSPLGYIKEMGGVAHDSATGKPFTDEEYSNLENVSSGLRSAEHKRLQDENFALMSQPTAWDPGLTEDEKAAVRNYSARIALPPESRARLERVEKESDELAHLDMRDKYGTDDWHMGDLVAEGKVLSNIYRGKASTAPKNVTAVDIPGHSFHLRYTKGEVVGTEEIPAKPIFEEKRSTKSSTLVHELGHALDPSLGNPLVGRYGRSSYNNVVNDEFRGSTVAEATADGFADRFSRHKDKFEGSLAPSEERADEIANHHETYGINHTGVSPDRLRKALYAAVRQHVSMGDHNYLTIPHQTDMLSPTERGDTGTSNQMYNREERREYEQENRTTATHLLGHLYTQHKHVRDILGHLNLSDVGEQAARQYRTKFTDASRGPSTYQEPLF